MASPPPPVRPVEVNLSTFGSGDEPTIHPITSSQTKHLVTNKIDLTPRQQVALEALVSREPGESYDSVANRAGISRVQLWRYMKDDYFMSLYQERVRVEFRAARMGVAKALIRRAEEGDSSSQRLYWQLSGMLTETIELTDKARNIETASVNPEDLPPELRKQLLEEIKGKLEEKVAGKGMTLKAAEEEEREDSLD